MTVPSEIGSSESAGVERFVPGPGIGRVEGLQFDVSRLVSDLESIVALVGYDETFAEWGFGVLPVTRRPGTSGQEVVDLSGRFWTRPDDSYLEVERDELVDEAAYTEISPAFAGSYFEEVVEALRARVAIGRVRVNLKQPYNANSWHRDPEPRLHIPVVTNPGSVFVLNNHATHLPADGSVYFTDTRGYHSAFNGGETARVHLVAAVLDGRPFLGDGSTT